MIQCQDKNWSIYYVPCFSIPLTGSQLIVSASYFHRLQTLSSASRDSAFSTDLPIDVPPHSWLSPLFIIPKTLSFGILSSTQQCYPNVRRKWGVFPVAGLNPTITSAQLTVGNLWTQTPAACPQFSAQSWLHFHPHSSVSAKRKSKSEIFCSTKSLLGFLHPIIKYTLTLSLESTEYY